MSGGVACFYLFSLDALLFLQKQIFNGQTEIFEGVN